MFSSRVAGLWIAVSMPMLINASVVPFINQLKPDAVQWTIAAHSFYAYNGQTKSIGWTSAQIIDETFVEHHWFTCLGKDANH